MHPFIRTQKRTALVGLGMAVMLGACQEPEADGMSWLMALSNAGRDACDSGGVLVHVGPDTNGDGALDASEIASTTAVCNGPDGAPGVPGEDGEDGQGGEDGQDGRDGEIGADGLAALITTASEPAGPNCAHGGLRIDVGVDNGDGGACAHDFILSPGEIDATSYLCNVAPGNDGAETGGTDAVGGTGGGGAPGDSGAGGEAQAGSGGVSG